MNLGSSRILALTAALGLSLVAAVPQLAHAQDSEALRALDAQLPGDLVNDPSRIDWESYGADLNASAVVDPSIPGGGAARRFEIKRAAEFIYTAGTNIPLTKSVSRGDTVTIGFYARTIDSAESDGRGVVRVRFQRNVEPYPGFGEETLSIGPNWEWYEVTAQAEQRLRSSDGIVAIQFGRTRQTIEIGQAIIVSGAPSIAAEGPISVAAVSYEIPELEMPDSLNGVGALINEPGQDRWRFGGTAGRYENLSEPEIWMMRATRFTVEEEGTELTSLNATVPINQSIAEGDNIVIALAARTIAASTPDGKGIGAVRVRGTFPPHDTFAANRFRVGDNWQLIRIETRAPRNFGAGAAELEIFFGGTVQQVELGPAYVFKAE